MFDFNKIQEYKDVLENIGAYRISFNDGYILSVDIETEYFELLDGDERRVNSYESFEDFKIKVAEYFLNN